MTVTPVTDVTFVTGVMWVTRVTRGPKWPSVTAWVLLSRVTEPCGKGRAKTTAYAITAAEPYTLFPLLPLPAWSVTAVTVTGESNGGSRAAPAHPLGVAGWQPRPSHCTSGSHWPSQPHASGKGATLHPPVPNRDAPASAAFYLAQLHDDRHAIGTMFLRGSLLTIKTRARHAPRLALIISGPRKVGVYFTIRYKKENAR
jgi:hypothetical protein